MTKARDISDLLDANGDVKSTALDNVPPSNDASALTTGTIDNARISLDANEIPNLDTAKITTGTFAEARMPYTVLNSNVDLTNLSASNLTSGTLPDARFPATLPAVSGANLTNIQGGSNTPSFYAYMPSNIAMAGATDVKVPTDTELWDTNSAFNTTNYRFTVPTGEDGKYVIIGSAEFGIQVENEYGRIRFHKNGSALTASEVRLVLDSAFPTIMKTVHIFDLSAGDYIEMYVRNLSSGGYLHGGKTHFQGFKLVE